MNKNDLRFIRTEENLKYAFLALLETRTVDDISIVELCQKAGCSRNAFYQHYETRYDLYDRMMKETIETIQASCNPVIDDLSEANDEIIRRYVHRLLEVIYSRRTELRSLLKSGSEFLETLRTSLYETMIRNDLKMPGIRSVNRRAKIMTEVIAGGISSFIRQWLTESSLSLAEAQELLDLCLRDLLRETVRSLLENG